MKCRNVCIILISVILCLSIRVTVQAEELPLEIRLEYLESQEEILVSIIAAEPVVLEAFTFAIVYDYDIYKLHKGYDVISNGYGYTQEFREHQGSAMMLSNALEDRVIFSGVKDAEENKAFEGTIAQVALLQYQSSQEDIPQIWLEISALQLNGENVAITGDNNKIFCEAVLENPNNNQSDSSVQTEDTYTDKSDVDGLQTNEPNNREEASSVIDNNNTDIQNNQASHTVEAEIYNHQSASENQHKNQSTIVTAQVVSHEAVLEAATSAANDSSMVKITENDKNTNHQKGRQQHMNVYQLLVGVCGICVVIAVPVLLLKYKRKRSE